MLTYTRARAEDVRALAGAIVLGSAAGLLMGGAFLATGAPKNPAPLPSPTPAAAPQAVAVRAAPPAKAHAGALQKPVATLRTRFSFADLAGRAARPFRFPEVAGAGADLNCLTQAVYFEARGEQTEGQQAVAQVVLNRVRHPAFPKTICAVVHQRSGAGCQFSFACSARGDAVADDSAWRRAQAVARAALHGSVMGAVGDATHFQTARGGPFAGLLKVAQIGAHVFYRFGGHAGSSGMFRQAPAPSAALKVELAMIDAAGPAPATPRSEALKAAGGKPAESRPGDALADKSAGPAAAAFGPPVVEPVKQASAKPAAVPATADPASAKPPPADFARSAPVALALARS